jgi:clan AA aspartic protease (TIGR02281 family)
LLGYYSPGMRGTTTTMKLATRLSIAGIAIVLALGGEIRSALMAQENSRENVDLLPRLGETRTEFEARINGVARPATAPAPSEVTVPADARGHFFVQATVNGTRVRMMVDTGATGVVLSREDARRIGINPQPSEFTARTSTANGVVAVAPIVLNEVTVGEILMRDVPALVHPDSRFQGSLLGMSFLSRLSQFEVSRGRLILKP